MARPRIPIDAAEVERLASCGLTLVQICDALAVHPETLRRRRRDYLEFADALARGRARGTAAVASALFEKATAGDLKAQIFFLKARAGWSEPDHRASWVSPYKEEDPLQDGQLEALNQRLGLPLHQHNPAH